MRDGTRIGLCERVVGNTFMHLVVVLSCARSFSLSLCRSQKMCKFRVAVHNRFPRQTVKTLQDCQRDDSKKTKKKKMVRSSDASRTFFSVRRLRLWLECDRYWGMRPTYQFAMQITKLASIQKNARGHWLVLCVIGDDRPNHDETVISHRFRVKSMDFCGKSSSSSGNSLACDTTILTLTYPNQ